MTKLLLVFLLLGSSGITALSQTPSPAPSASLSTNQQHAITQYELPPERHQQAHELNRIYFRHQLIVFAYSCIVLCLILFSKLGVRFRNLSKRISGRGFLQTIFFTLFFVFTLSVFQLPADAYIHRVSTRYGLSIQGWPSWFWDWTKSQLLVAVGATIFVLILYAVIRRSSQRWWLYFWMASFPIVLFLVFVQPLILDPLFNKFGPLAEKDPALATSLSTMAQHAGEDIPIDRMFWMNASAKTTTLNAYVTGFGSSKRIVVWDTTMQKLSTPEIVFVAAHEMGHYVLQHVPKGLALGAIFSLVICYLGFLIFNWAIKRFGPQWDVHDVADVASLPALLLVVSVLVFISNPMVNAVSRYFEHQADQYALEITHGLTPESGQVCAQTFQILGNVGLSDPDPQALNVFLFYDHPAIDARLKFCLAYDPWSKGESPSLTNH
jgi:STE24 endopeptidase